MDNTNSARTAMKVLVVDDEPDIELLFRQRFRKEVRAGLFDFQFAHAGEAALEYLNSGAAADIMLVLSDINMPGMTGLELLKRVRATFPDLTMFMITAYGDENTYQTAMADGARDYLTKPIDFEALKAKMVLMES